MKGCILTKKPGVYFDDIAGNSYAKMVIKEAFILPFAMPELFNNCGRPKPWKKLLIYGVINDFLMLFVYNNMILNSATWGRKDNDGSSHSN